MKRDNAAWMRGVLLAAVLCNVLWGAIVVLFPWRCSGLWGWNWTTHQPKAANS
jgi:hypothetical protein